MLKVSLSWIIVKQIQDLFLQEMAPRLSGHIKSRFLCLVLTAAQLKSKSIFQCQTIHWFLKQGNIIEELLRSYREECTYPKKGCPSKVMSLCSIIDYNAARQSCQKFFFSLFASFKKTSSVVTSIFQIKLSPDVEAMHVTDHLYRMPQTCAQGKKNQSKREI